MQDRPDPLVPDGVDLRDFAFMPLEVRRLLTSETWVLGRPEEKVAALTLWCEAWHQVPAGSLPDNERMLAHLSQAGAAWRKVREHAMRGWVLCSDGRWYHPVIAEKALESWSKKVAQRDRTRRATQARWKRDERTLSSVSDSVTDASTDSVTDDVTESVTFTKGEGEGERELATLAARAHDPPGRPEEPPPTAEPSGAVRLAIEARRHGVQTHGGDPRLIELARLGVDEQRMAAACTEAARKQPGKPPAIGYVAKILEAWMGDAERLRHVAPAAPQPKRVAL